MGCDGVGVGVGGWGGPVPLRVEPQHARFSASSPGLVSQTGCSSVAEALPNCFRHSSLARRTCWSPVQFAEPKAEGALPCFLRHIFCGVALPSVPARPTWMQPLNAWCRSPARHLKMNWTCSKRGHGLGGQEAHRPTSTAPRAQRSAPHPRHLVRPQLSGYELVHQHLLVGRLTFPNRRQACSGNRMGRDWKDLAHWAVCPAPTSNKYGTCRAQLVREASSMPLASSTQNKVPWLRLRSTHLDTAQASLDQTAQRRVHHSSHQCRCQMPPPAAAQSSPA